jgi:hypothetical protein
VVFGHRHCPGEVDRLWQAFLRRSGLEHTFRLFKQVLGWITPKVRSPEAADRFRSNHRLAASTSAMTLTSAFPNGSVVSRPGAQA